MPMLFVGKTNNYFGLALKYRLGIDEFMKKGTTICRLLKERRFVDY